MTKRHSVKLFRSMLPAGLLMLGTTAMLFSAPLLSPVQAAVQQSGMTASV